MDTFAVNYVAHARAVDTRSLPPPPNQKVWGQAKNSTIMHDMLKFENWAYTQGDDSVHSKQCLC